jgi:hypothetical protein
MPPKSKKDTKSQVVISNATVIISNSKSNSSLKPKKEKRPTIPKKIRQLVWNTHIGESIGMAKCLCCNEKDISQMEFHCGHIISYHNGGADSVDNMRPICASCNLSMGADNMDTFIERHQLTGNISNLTISCGKIPNPIVESASISQITPPPLIKSENELFEEERVKLEAEWNAKKGKVIAYIENVKDKREKMKHLISTVVNDKSRIHFNITGRDLTNEMSNPCKDGNMHNKIYIDYGISMQQFSSSCGDCMLSNFIGNVLTCVTRGHWQFKHGYYIRDSQLDAIIWYLTNTPLNDKFEEFIDGFLNCMNADPTF